MPNGLAWNNYRNATVIKYPMLHLFPWTYYLYMWSHNVCMEKCLYTNRISNFPYEIHLECIWFLVWVDVYGIRLLNIFHVFFLHWTLYRIRNPIFLKKKLKRKKSDFTHAVSEMAFLLKLLIYRLILTSKEVNLNRLCLLVSLFFFNRNHTVNLTFLWT